MESIRVTLPLGIDPEKVVLAFEQGMAANSNCQCKVQYLGVDEKEHLFAIHSEHGPKAFYYAGIIGAQLLRLLQ
jgi:hypothetical protein